MSSPDGQANGMARTAVRLRFVGGTSCHPIDLHKGYRTASRGQTQPKVPATREVPP